MFVKRGFCWLHAVGCLLVCGLISYSASSQTLVDKPVANNRPADDRLTDEQMKLVKSFEQQRINAINQVIGSVVAIYDVDRQGGGSGVVFDPSGLALTNHHVIMGAGVTGWGEWPMASSTNGG